MSGAPACHAVAGVGGSLAKAGWTLDVSTMGRFSLRNKVALITGGSRGLGLIIAQKLCRAGAKVALIARDADELARAESDLAGRGGGGLKISCALLDRPQIEAAVQETINRFGTINILINNAGISQIGPLE